MMFPNTLLPHLQLRVRLEHERINGDKTDTASVCYMVVLSARVPDWHSWETTRGVGATLRLTTLVVYVLVASTLEARDILHTLAATLKSG